MTLAGSIIADRYRLDTLIGRGASANVFRAYDIRLGREVAVKVAREEQHSSLRDSRRFSTEARALACLSHSHIVTIHDFHELEDGTGWRLASDMYDASEPGGYSAHGDWFDGWDPEVSTAFVRNCDNKSVDCHRICSETVARSTTVMKPNEPVPCCEPSRRGGHD